MTQSGICDNASFDATRLTRQQARELQPAWRRTIAYPWSWGRVIDSAREVARLGVKTLVVFNTEAWGGPIDDLDTMAARLRSFLYQADGAVHAIEPGNEVDTRGWTDSKGRPISDGLIIQIGRKAAEVCADFGVICLSPSLLTGPGEGRFEPIARGLAGHVAAMAVHPYYRSMGGHPWPDWHYGSVEGAADECERLGHGLPTWFTELGCTSVYDNIGEPTQALYTSALRAFQHPSIPVVMQFAVADLVGGQGELDQGKDWGLIDQYGRIKEAYAAYANALPPAAIDPPPAPQPAPVQVPPDVGWVGSGLQAELDRLGWTPTSDEHDETLRLVRAGDDLVVWDQDRGALAYRRD